MISPFRWRVLIYLRYYEKSLAYTSELPEVEISVYDHDHNLVEDAELTLKPIEKGEPVHLSYERSTGTYRSKEVRTGSYVLKVEADNFKSEERQITVSPNHVLKDVVILGLKNHAFYYRGKVKVPFEPKNDIVAVSTGPTTDQETLTDQLSESTSNLDLEDIPVNPSISKSGVHVFKMRSGLMEDSGTTRLKIQEELSKNPSIRTSGPIVQMNDDSLSFLTNQLVVKFKPDIRKDEISSILNDYGMEIIREIPYANNTFVISTKTLADYSILNTCEQIVQSGKVEYAEPNLISTVVEDSMHPTDFLFSRQWHLITINAPSAWSILDNRDHNIAFGSPSIIIAVMDSGIDSGHPDLSGNLVNGLSKIYHLYDFATMAPNNDKLDGHHGTCCAGVAAAKVQNPSTVQEETEGVVGVAGNCRLIGLRHPGWQDGLETRFADAYIWAAGLDPHSNQAGFPPPINPGADIITSSFGYSVGQPISGLMKDTFDFIITNGRGGKGVLLFFSAGNANTDFTLQRPWAAYEKTFAVAASSLTADGTTEFRSPYSNYGGLGRAGGIIDFCAPSSDGPPPAKYGISTTTIRGSGDLSGHTSGDLDYTSQFGGTSSATPLSAGVAALILSANPNLTWNEIREIMRSTAVKIDSHNSDQIGRWTDINGKISSEAGYAGPYYSRWYGHGRLDAAAALKSII
jgi:Subtilase family